MSIRAPQHAIAIVIFGGIAMAVVNSWNDWDPLEEVIVGSVRNTADIAYEPALAPYYPPGDPGRAFKGARVPQVVLDDAERQLDHFAALLEKLGITVRRPDPVDHAVAVTTPDWSVPFGHACACPRDTLLVIGDEIIEAPMAQRARWFEFRAYRTLIAGYFRDGARWTMAPKPLMTDTLYRERGAAPFDFTEMPLLNEIEPAFDAACFARLGRDIFWRPDLVSNALGAEWLQRHLGPQFRVHRIAFREPLPTHIDTTLVPLRPGIVLTNPSRPCLDGMMSLFAANGWRAIDAPISVRAAVRRRHATSATGFRSTS